MDLVGVKLDATSSKPANPSLKITFSTIAKMSSSRKYAELLDIDPEAPDVFETPDLTDDTSTIPTSTSPPPESSTEDIDRHHIDPDEARTHFLPSGQRDPASATRIASKRKGYRSSSNWPKKEGLEVNGDELSSEEEEEEGLERKLARLRREIAEVKGEVERRKAEGDGKLKLNGEEEAQDLEALSEVLSSVGPASGFGGGEHGAATRLTKKLAAASSAPTAITSPKPPSSTQQPHPTSTVADPSTTYTLTYAPTYDQTHTLSKITTFDTRLSALEALLGIDTLPLPTQETRPAAKPLLPTLEILDRQLATLTTSTDSSLDTLSRRVRQLTSETQTLESARKVVKAAAREGPGTPTTAASNPPDGGVKDADLAVSALADPDNIAKIHALYGTLPTIEALAPLLPATLDRLRSLRALHADAGVASQALRRVEERQESVREDIRGWRMGLESVERAVREGGKRMRENTEVVEGWVRDLEARMERLAGSV